MINLVCDKCGKEYTIKRKIYNQRIRRGTPNYCSDCMKIHHTEKVKQTKLNMSEEQKKSYSKNLSNANKLRWKNMNDNEKEKRIKKLNQQNEILKKSWTDEQRKVHGEKISKSKNNMDKEDYQQMIENMSNSMTQYHSKMNIEDKKLFSKQIKDGMGKMSDEEKQRMRQGWKNWYDSLSKEEKINYISPMLYGLQEFWNNMDEDEYNNRVSKLSENSNIFWRNITEDEYQNICLGIRNSNIERWKNMTSEQRGYISEKISKSLKKYWDDLPQEEKEQHIDRIVIGMNNMSDKDKLSMRNKQSKSLTEYWRNINHTDYEKMIKSRLIKSSGNNKLHQKFEKYFKRSFISYTHYFKKEVVLFNSDIRHSWDYALYNIKNNELEMVVDLDGTYFHADNCDYDGMHSRLEYDAKRSLSVSNDIKIFIIQENNFDNCFNLMMYYSSLSYQEYLDYKFDMLRLIPFPQPEYTDTELIKSYIQLCKLDCNDKYHQKEINNREGDRIIHHFHTSLYSSIEDIWYNDSKLKDNIKNNFIYHSHLNKNKILQSLVNNISPGKMKVLINKYLFDVDSIFNPYHKFSEIMLASLSLNKKYIGSCINEISKNESEEIIKFLNNIFDINASISIIDKYDSVITNLIDCENSDHIIEKCLREFICSKYLFMVNDSIKYKNNIVDKIFEGYIVLIEKDCI